MWTGVIRVQWSWTMDAGGARGREVADAGIFRTACARARRATRKGRSCSCQPAVQCKLWRTVAPGCMC